MVAALATGKIIRYSEAKGYGFIAPDDGGEDLFVHVNDVDFSLNDRSVGMKVSYEVMEGQKGLKAYNIKYVGGAVGTPTARPAADSGDVDEDSWDVIAADAYTSEITELLMEVAPTLTGVQIMRIRDRLAAAAFKRGWIVTG